MYRNVTTIGYMFEEIEKNLKFFVERRDTHTKSKINFIKIFIINIKTKYSYH